MKHKLIVTLVATALELYAASATAQVGSCFLGGNSKSANAATPVTAGPLNPIDGFPEYVVDSAASPIAAQRCLDPAWCFFDPIIPSDPFSIQIGSGGEAFYWSADAILNNDAGTPVFKLVMAAETAFLQAGPNGEPINGSQFPFLRLRYVFDAPEDGIYTLSHPYGQEEFEVIGATGNRDIFTTYDRGLNANSTITGNVGPFMTSVSIPAPGFLGDANAATTDLATGGPCFVNDSGFNTVTLTGYKLVNNVRVPVNFGSGESSISTDQFIVQGQLYDGRVQTPVDATRATYTRVANIPGTTTGGKIEAFATSSVNATVTVADGPTVPVGSSQITAPVTLDRTTLTAVGAAAAEGIDSKAVPVLNAAALPPVLNLTATDTVTLNTAGLQKYDATSINLRLVDFVDIATADFDPATNILTVAASSGDQRVLPTLSVRGLGSIDRTTGLFSLTTVAPPAVVHVDSSAGGTSSAQVRVIAAVAPAAPGTPVPGVATAHTVALTWADNSDNETGFRIYAAAAGVPEFIAGTAGINATGATIGGLLANTLYTFRVEAINGVGQASSATAQASTLAVPAAVGSVAFGFDTAVQRRINVSWAASADATSYVVTRRIGANAATQVAVVPAGQLSLADTVPAPAGGLAYVYQVAARRTIAGIDDDSTVTASISQTAVGNPTSPAITSVPVSGNNVTINWNDRSNNEWGFQVYRRVAAPVGAFAAVSPLLAATAGGSTTVPVARNFVDSAVPGGSYHYRVDVSNWAITVQSAVFPNTGSINVVALNAVTNLTADINGRPTLAWTDNSVNESGYRAARSRAVVAANGTVTFDQTTNLTQAANSTGFREAAALTANRTYRYVVTPLNGTTVGPAVTVWTFVDALPTPNAPTFTNNNATGVTVNWTLGGGASTLSVGGYEVQRCIANAAGTACATGQVATKLNGTAVNTAGTVDGRTSLNFRDTTAVAGTRYRYFVRAVGGQGVSNAAGTALVGPLGAGASVLKN